MVTDAVLRVAVAAITLPGRVGPGRVPVGDRGRFDRLADSAAGLPGVARGRADAHPGSTVTFLRGAAHSIAAAGASAILVMGFPVLLKATSARSRRGGRRGDPRGHADPRALLVPLTAMQGNLIAHFVDQRAARLRALLRRPALVVGLGADRVPLAGLAGPWLLQSAFGSQYQAGGALLAWFTAAAIAIALLTLTGAATVAAALHRAYAVGWIGATLASTLLLLLRCRFETRTVVALMCGPLVGIAVHLVAAEQGSGTSLSV